VSPRMGSGGIVIAANALLPERQRSSLAKKINAELFCNHGFAFVSSLCCAN